MKPQFTEGTDITARLTTWCHAPHAESAQDLMDEAAKEIERLRCVTEPLPKEKRAEHLLRLTDKEREAIEAAIRIIVAHDEEMDGFPSCAAATLRSLLERLS